jgi:hypothetical protein
MLYLVVFVGQLFVKVHVFQVIVVSELLLPCILNLGM